MIFLLLLLSCGGANLSSKTKSPIPASNNSLSIDDDWIVITSNRAKAYAKPQEVKGKSNQVVLEDITKNVIGTTKKVVKSISSSPKNVMNFVNKSFERFWGKPSKVKPTKEKVIESVEKGALDFEIWGRQVEKILSESRGFNIPIDLKTWSEYQEWVQDTKAPVTEKSIIAFLDKDFDSDDWDNEDEDWEDEFDTPKNENLTILGDKLAEAYDWYQKVKEILKKDDELSEEIEASTYEYARYITFAEQKGISEHNVTSETLRDYANWRDSYVLFFMDAVWATKMKNFLNDNPAFKNKFDNSKETLVKFRKYEEENGLTSIKQRNDFSIENMEEFEEYVFFELSEDWSDEDDWD